MHVCIHTLDGSRCAVRAGTIKVSFAHSVHMNYAFFVLEIRNDISIFLLCCASKAHEFKGGKSM